MAEALLRRDSPRMVTAPDRRLGFDRPCLERHGYRRFGGCRGRMRRDSIMRSSIPTGVGSRLRATMARRRSGTPGPARRSRLRWTPSLRHSRGRLQPRRPAARHRVRRWHGAGSGTPRPAGPSPTSCRTTARSATSGSAPTAPCSRRPRPMAMQNLGRHHGSDAAAPAGTRPGRTRPGLTLDGRRLATGGPTVRRASGMLPPASSRCLPWSRLAGRLRSRSDPTVASS